MLRQVVSQYRPLLCWVLSWQSGAITETCPFGRAVAGPVTGVTPVTNVPPVVVPGTWPLGNVVVGSVMGATSGTSSPRSTSLSIRVELAH